MYTCIKTDRQTDRQTARQAGRQTDRQTAGSLSTDLAIFLAISLYPSTCPSIALSTFVSISLSRSLSPGYRDVSPSPGKNAHPIVLNRLTGSQERTLTTSNFSLSLSLSLSFCHFVFAQYTSRFELASLLWSVEIHFISSFRSTCPASTCTG